MDITKAFDNKDGHTLARLLRHMQAVREHFPHVAYMKDALVKDDKFMFMEAWGELSDSVKVDLWVAPKYGGVWTTQERKTVRQWDTESFNSRV